MSKFFKDIREEYTKQKERRSVLKHVKTITTSDKVIKELNDHITVLNKSIARLENLYPKWTIDFKKEEPIKRDLSYPDLNVVGISELFKAFRAVFMLVLPKQSRKSFSLIMTDYTHQYINVNKMNTFTEERERFIDYIKIRFQL